MIPTLCHGGRVVSSNSEGHRDWFIDILTCPQGLSEAEADAIMAVGADLIVNGSKDSCGRGR